MRLKKNLKLAIDNVINQDIEARKQHQSQCCVTSASGLKCCLQSEEIIALVAAELEKVLEREKANA